MNKKIFSVMVLAFVLVVGIAVFKAYAFGYEQKECCGSGFEEKFTLKIHMIFKNQEDLGISDKQMAEIKSLKIKIKKDLIQKKAEQDIAELDLKAVTSEDVVDSEVAGKLMDKRYDLEKEKEKASLGAYVELEKILTDEQKTKLKALCKESVKEMMHGAMKKGDMPCAMMEGKMKHQGKPGMEHPESKEKAEK